MPFGQLPVLEIDGKQLAQSLAIGRYLARKFGYAGKSEFEEAVADSILDQSKDFLIELTPYFRTLFGMKEAQLQDALEKDLVLPAREKFFTYLTKFLKSSKSGKYFFLKNFLNLRNYYEK
ncbi:unnamed protein product [Heligmosomoides polygyrus]|uniref:glutathione transferase n=1 Tax=Heligmosomoides polygyrus TaxID=6339 RepID=A0A183FRS3_HELPZ|nr:unnamed protein product [Heligmosomoides polygyrus]